MIGLILLVILIIAHVVLRPRLYETMYGDLVIFYNWRGYRKYLLIKFKK